jgi:hypothetical protein
MAITRSARTARSNSVTAATLRAARRTRGSYRGRVAPELGGVETELFCQSRPSLEQELPVARRPMPKQPAGSRKIDEIDAVGAYDLHDAGEKGSGVEIRSRDVAKVPVRARVSVPSPTRAEQQQYLEAGSSVSAFSEGVRLPADIDAS